MYQLCGNFRCQFVRTVFKLNAHRDEFAASLPLPESCLVQHTRETFVAAHTVAYSLDPEPGCTGSGGGEQDPLTLSLSHPLTPSPPTLSPSHPLTLSPSRSGHTGLGARTTSVGPFRSRVEGIFLSTFGECYLIQVAF